MSPDRRTYKSHRNALAVESRCGLEPRAPVGTRASAAQARRFAREAGAVEPVAAPGGTGGTSPPRNSEKVQKAGPTFTTASTLKNFPKNFSLFFKIFLYFSKKFH